MLDIVESYPCVQFQGKLIIQTQENDNKPHFRPDLGPLDPHGQLSLCTISEETNDPIFEKT